MAEELPPAMVPASPAPAAPAMRRTRTPKRAGMSPVIRWLRRGIAAAVVLALLTAVILALLPTPVPVEEALVTRGPLVAAVEGDGVTRVRDRYLVLAPLGGTMTRVLVNEGDPVKEGEVLTRILAPQPPLLDVRSRAEARARVDTAQAALRQALAVVEQARAARDIAKSEAARDETLVKQGAITARQADRSEAEARAREAAYTSATFAATAARHELAVAEAALVRLESPGSREALEVTAPVDGRILRVVRESEGTVAPGAPIVEIGNVRDLEAVVDLLTTDAVRIPPGARATIVRWGGREPLEARVRTIEPSAFTKTSALGVDEQRVNVILELTDSPEKWEALGDAFRVEARVVVWEGHDVLRIPIGAAFRHGEGWATYVVADGRARLREIRLGERGERELQVLEGLSPGERVIAYPSDAVRDGVRVEPQRS